MNVKDLRIGNYLRKENTVVQIDARSIFDMSAPNGMSKYEPIPLTEEWLLKFGFIDRYNARWLQDNKMTTWEVTIIDGKFHVTVNGDEYRLCELHYVHELQNVYHSLTGEELTLKQ